MGRRSWQHKITHGAWYCTLLYILYGILRLNHSLRHLWTSTSIMMVFQKMLSHQMHFSLSWDTDRRLRKWENTVCFHHYWCDRRGQLRATIWGPQPPWATGSTTFQFESNATPCANLASTVLRNVPCKAPCTFRATDNGSILLRTLRAPSTHQRTWLAPASLAHLVSEDGHGCPSATLTIPVFHSQVSHSRSFSNSSTPWSPTTLFI